MCEICLRSPCPSGCPNADPEVPELTCDICGKEIYYDDLYYDFNSEKWCSDCVEKCSRIAGE